MNTASTPLQIPVLGFAAYSGTGKTTLLESLLPKLTDLGLRVGVFKHAHHDFDVDKPGKDSYRLRKAGANQMLIASRNRHVLMTETPEQEANFFALLDHFDTTSLDLILVEGCKNLSFPKIELHREEVGKPWLHPHDSNIIAIASDSRSLENGALKSNLPHVSINDLDAICKLITSFAKGLPLKAKTEEQPKLDSSCDALSPAFLSVEDGLNTLLSGLKISRHVEHGNIFNARLRVLAQDIESPINVPAYCNSAMDGYAVKADDILAGITTFEVIAEIMAGSGFDGEIKTGQAVKIMTGAPMPIGVDSVIMREQSQQSENGHSVTFLISKDDFKAGQNVRQAGEDLAKDSVVFSQGKRLLSPEIGMLASIGIENFPLYSQLKVAIFSTGDEVQAPGSELNNHCIYDSNRFSLMGLLQNLGCEVIDLGIIDDNEYSLEQALLNASSQADVIISSGGVSVGDADFIKTVLNKIGEINFWRINMRPGRPLAFGHINDKPFFGLPGNPVAVMVAFLTFVEPALRLMQGEHDWQPTKMTAETTDKVFSRLGRTEFTRGVYHLDEFGRLKVRTTGKQGSGILRSMSEANCLIEIPPQVELAKPGEMVTIIPLQGRI